MLKSMSCEKIDETSFSFILEIQAGIFFKYLDLNIVKIPKDTGN